MNTTLYVIVDTRERGDAAVFWAPDEQGYTTDLDKAGLYTDREAERIERRRGTDRAVEFEAASKLAHRIVDKGCIASAKGLPKKGAST